MTPAGSPAQPGAIIYPSSDGKPMADNTKQGRWIVVLYGNISALMRERDDVFVAPDNMWYPVEGHPEICTAPDVYVVFGRPKGDRPSYRQWEENEIPLTVVFEVRSPGNTDEEMREKQLFYEEHGVEEYYVYDPDINTLEVYTRGIAALVRRRPADGFVSPRLGIRFDLSGEEMAVYYPDGERFLSFEELTEDRDRQRLRANRAEQDLAQTIQRVDQAEQRANHARQAADQAVRDANEAKQLAEEARRQAEEAQKREDQARRQADEARQREDEARRQAEEAQNREDEARRLAKEAQKREDESRRLANEAQRQQEDTRRSLDNALHRAARLAELSRKVRRAQASAEEIAELERLEEEDVS